MPSPTSLASSPIRNPRPMKGEATSSKAATPPYRPPTVLQRRERVKKADPRKPVRYGLLFIHHRDTVIAPSTHKACDGPGMRLSATAGLIRCLSSRASSQPQMQDRSPPLDGDFPDGQVSMKHSYRLNPDRVKSDNMYSTMTLSLPPSGLLG